MNNPFAPSPDGNPFGPAFEPVTESMMFTPPAQFIDSPFATPTQNTSHNLMQNTGYNNSMNLSGYATTETISSTFDNITNSPSTKSSMNAQNAHNAQNALQKNAEYHNTQYSQYPPQYASFPQQSPGEYQFNMQPQHQFISPFDPWQQAVEQSQQYFAKEDINMNSNMNSNMGYNIDSNWNNGYSYQMSSFLSPPVPSPPILSLPVPSPPVLLPPVLSPPAPPPQFQNNRHTPSAFQQQQSINYQHNSVFPSNNISATNAQGTATLQADGWCSLQEVINDHQDKESSKTTGDQRVIATQTTSTVLTMFNNNDMSIKEENETDDEDDAQENSNSNNYSDDDYNDYNDDNEDDDDESIDENIKVEASPKEESIPAINLQDTATCVGTTLKQCPICQTTEHLSLANDFDEHVREEHVDDDWIRTPEERENNKPKYLNKCPACGEACYRLCNVILHLSKNCRHENKSTYWTLNRKKKVYCCRICSKEYYSKDSARVHVNKEHKYA